MISLAEELKLINQFRKTAPVNVEGLVRALGLGLRFANLDPEVSGMIEKDGNSFNIIVNENDSETRRRFTISHELGHYILHRNKIGNGIEDNRAYRSMSSGKFKNDRIGQKEETQANQFAANLLIPYDLVLELKKEGIKEAEALANRLCVSKKAMEIRLRTMPPDL